MKMFGLMIGAILLCLNVSAFPKATEEEKARFRKLFRECYTDHSSEVMVSSTFDVHLRLPSYKRLLEFGPEILELICEEGKDLETKRGESFGLLVARGQHVLGSLWIENTLRITKRFTDVDPLWEDDPIESILEGGDAIANARAAFLVNEMRIAKQENRHIDERRAMGNLQLMGIFAFPTLFGELEQGHDDVIEVLVAEEWRKTDKPVLTKEGLLEWWKKNSKKYELPPMSPNFRGSPQLEKWERIEDPNRKIRVYDPAVDDPVGLKATNHVTRLAEEDLLRCFASISLSGTNACLKCKSTGMQFRCIFNGIKYGRRRSNGGEVLELPEGNNLLLKSTEDTELTFLPLVAIPSGERGFFVKVKTYRGWHHKQQTEKAGYLVFDSSGDNATDSKSKIRGLRLKPSLGGKQEPTPAPGT